MFKLIVKAPVSEGEQKEYSYEFDQPVVTIGRLKENDIPLPVSTVSGFHAQIVHEGEDYYIVDRGSINGTYLNAQRIPGGEKKLLRDDDVIRIQSFELYFSTGLALMKVDQGATVQLARQMVMEVLGSWQSQEHDKPRILIMGGPSNGQQLELSEGKNLAAGRGSNCDIIIEHPSISRKHAEITMTWSGAFINDLNSANGVYVNDRRINVSQKLHDRDEIRLGQQNSANAIRLIFSNPAEALLSKIENQLTDSSPGQLQSAVVTEEAARHAAEQPTITAGSTEAVASVPEPPPPPAAEPSAPAPNPPATPPAPPPPVAAAPITPSQKKGANPAAVIGGVVLLVAGVGFALFYMLSKSTFAMERVEPDKAKPGAVVILRGNGLDKAGIRKISILNKDAEVIRRDSSQIEFRVPQTAQLQSIETSTEVVVRSEDKTLGRFPFTVLMDPELKSITPASAKAGSEIKIRTNGGASRATVYFNSQKVDARPNGENELVARVPKQTGNEPPEGVPVKVTLRIGNTAAKNHLDFTILPGQTIVPVQQVETPKIEAFQLAFEARPHNTALGFNEHSVHTNIGPLLILTAKDTYSSSQKRAEEIARNLNQALPLFQQDPKANVQMVQEGDHYSIYGISADGQTRADLVHVFQDDVLAYGKINQRTISHAEVANWWKMLLAAYFRVFVQVQNPADTGILASGGTIFQQIYNFYPNTGENGEKFYKVDFPQSLPNDQKSRLISLSLSPPRRISSVEGKWTGYMSNILYRNISEENLELILNLRQNSDGTISGNAELNWKVVMGESRGGFENVAYKKLGIFGLNGTFHREKTFPVEFSFVEKDGRRLNFVGRFDADILGGRFVNASSNEEGNWSVSLRK